MRITCRILATVALAVASHRSGLDDPQPATRRRWLDGREPAHRLGEGVRGCSNAPQSNYRTAYAKGGFFKRDSGQAARIGGSVNLGPISVGATSGYSVNVSEQWTAVAGPIWLCGTHAFPGTRE